jgi:LAO/AO transport system kinase
MQRHATDEGVFVRSMATRGHLGGLSRATYEASLVLDAMGYDVILVETVGVGQDEVEIVDLAHTTAVVSLPGMGDDIQAMKAGILEIGDIFIVNKADKPGADEVVKQLRVMLEMRSHAAGDWLPRVFKTVASLNEGIGELIEGFLAHREHLMASNTLCLKVEERERYFFREIVKELAYEKIRSTVADTEAYRSLLAALRERRVDPYSAAEKLLEHLNVKV